VDIKGVKVLATRSPDADAKNLRDLADKLRDKLGNGVIALGAESEGKVTVLVAVTKELSRSCRRRRSSTSSTRRWRSRGREAGHGAVRWRGRRCWIRLWVWWRRSSSRASDNERIAFRLNCISSDDRCRYVVSTSSPRRECLTVWRETAFTVPSACAVLRRVASTFNHGDTAMNRALLRIILGITVAVAFGCHHHATPCSCSSLDAD